MFTAGPAANTRWRSLRGARINSSVSGSAKAPMGSSPRMSSPNDLTRMPCARASTPWPYSWITRAMISPASPQPRGMAGEMPGRAISSRAGGGSVCWGMNSTLSTGSSTNSSTTSRLMARQVHSPSSPNMRQNSRGRDTASSTRWPRLVRTISTIPITRVASQRSSTPARSSALRMMYQMTTPASKGWTITAR